MDQDLSDWRTNKKSLKRNLGGVDFYFDKQVI